MATKKRVLVLKAKDGKEIRTLQDLQESFDIDSILGFYLDGRLKEWLKELHYEDKANQIQRLKSKDPDLTKKLCEILGVDYIRYTLTSEELKARNQKLERLKAFTDDEEILDQVDDVAFSQEELADLLDEGLDTIYICGNDFHIPLSKRNVTYVAIQAKIVLT